MKLPKPPSYLRVATQKWFTNVVTEYSLEEHHVRILTLACQAWDRVAQAREALTKHGMVYTDRFGQPHARPEIGVERDGRIAFARLIRELALDVDGPSEGYSRTTAIQPGAHRRIS